jgi:hypothetical protein
MVVQAGQQHPAGRLHDLFTGFRPQSRPALGDHPRRQAHVGARQAGEDRFGGQVGIWRPHPGFAD